MNKVFFAFILLLAYACSPKHEHATATIEPSSAEAISFSGKPLFAPSVDPEVLAKTDSIIASLKATSDLTEEDYIQIGLQLIGSSRYNAAIENYTEGLQKFPSSFKLLRHRGHRYISIRQLEKAISDLNQAEELIRDQPDVLEYDAAGKTTGTYQHWIWYHIGLYYFLNQAYLQAAPAYEKCLEASRSDKNIVGASDWLYNTYMRLGKVSEAQKLLEPITPDFDTDREHPYFRRVMLYKGVITPEELVDVNQDPASTSVGDVTKMYGLANWYAYQGDQEKAMTLYKKIVQSESGWPGFAFAAAEKELANAASAQ
ncbi:MAG: tetratricopeptide repeat protein [Cyclobacteriaceae bacterium]